MNESDATNIIRLQQGVRHFVGCRVLVDAGLSVIIFSPLVLPALVGVYVRAVSFVISECVRLTSLIHTNFIYVKTKEASVDVYCISAWFLCL